MKKLAVFTLVIGMALSIQAQTPQLPSGQPGKVSLPTPKFKPLKPDLMFISSRVISVVEVESRHLFETTISITLKNQGSVATSTGFFLDLRNRYGTTSGGTGYSIIGAQANINPMEAGETRTVKFVFAKDITAMGRARLQCVIRIDSGNSIAESNEENNTSSFFDITPPRL
jgi:hypothetical protein